MAGRSQANRLESGGVKYPWHTILWVFIRKILKYVVLSLLTAAVVYLGVISTTVSRYIYIYNNGYVYTKTPNSDELPAGTKVVFDTAKNASDVSDANSVLGRFSLSTLPPTTVAVGTIVSGPNGKVSYDDQGNVFVNAKSIGINRKNIPEREYLSDEYIIKCSYGACNRGEYNVLTSKSVDGIVIRHKENE
jgi:vancomycin permeability regulator SanA